MLRLSIDKTSTSEKNINLPHKHDLFILLVYACGKGGGGTTPPDPCNGVTVTVNGTVTNPVTVGGTDGSIAVSATGGSGFTYKLGSRSGTSPELLSAALRQEVIPLRLKMRTVVPALPHLLYTPLIPVPVLP